MRRFLTVLFCAFSVLGFIRFPAAICDANQQAASWGEATNFGSCIEVTDNLKASLQIKPPYIHINKFRKKKGTNVIVLRIYVCADAPKEGKATKKDCKASAKDKNLGNVTGIEITTKDRFGKSVYSKVKNFDKLDNRYGGTQDLEFTSNYLERNSEYIVTVILRTRKGDVSHNNVALMTPR